MLEFIGIATLGVATIWGISYLWRFWLYRQSIRSLEELAVKILGWAGFASSADAPGADAEWEKALIVSSYLQGIADTLSSGKLADLQAIQAQLDVLDGLIGSPGQIAYFLGGPRALVNIAPTMSNLCRARNFFVTLARVNGHPLI